MTTPAIVQKRHQGSVTTGRITFLILQKLRTMLDPTEWAHFDSNEPIPNPAVNEAKKKALRTQRDSADFSKLSTNQKKEVRDKIEDKTKDIEDDKAKAKEMTAVAMKVLTFYNDNFDSATIAGDLEMLRKNHPCVMQLARQFRKYVLDNWGGDPEQVRQEMDDDLAAVDEVATKKGLLEMLRRSDAIRAEIDNHYTVNPDAAEANIILAPTTDEQYVNYIRARISNNSSELYKIRGLIDDKKKKHNRDGSQTMGKRISLSKLRSSIIDHCQQNVRTVGESRGSQHSSTTMSSNHAIQLQEAHSVTAAVAEVAQTEIASLQQQVRELRQQQQQQQPQQAPQAPYVAPEHTPSAAQRFIANAAYGQTGMGLVPQQHRGGGNYQQGLGYQPATNKPPYTSMQPCTFWNGSVCTYGPGQCFRANTHIPGQDQRPYHIVEEERAAALRAGVPQRSAADQHRMGN